MVALEDAVQGPAQPFAAIVQPQCGETAAQVAAVDRGLAVAVQPVEADAPLVVGPVAACHVDVDAEVGVTDVGRRQARQRRVTGALADDVDGTADAAAGRDAVDQRAGPAEQLDPLDDLRLHAVGGHEAVQAVQPDIRGTDLEAADLEGVIEAVGPGGEANRRIVDQRVGGGASLLILDQLRGVVGGAERRVQHAPGPQQAERPAPRHLAARIGLRQCARCLTGDLHHRQHDRLKRVRSARGSNGRGRTGGRRLLRLGHRCRREAAYNHGRCKRPGQGTQMHVGNEKPTWGSRPATVLGGQTCGGHVVNSPHRQQFQNSRTMIMRMLLTIEL